MLIDQHYSGRMSPGCFCPVISKASNRWLLPSRPIECERCISRCTFGREFVVSADALIGKVREPTHRARSTGCLHRGLSRSWATIQRTTCRMVFSFAEILAFLSVDFTFVPGDVILGGTGAGTAQDSTKLDANGVRPRGLFLNKGDTIAVSSPLIGVLENRVV